MRMLAPSGQETVVGVGQISMCATKKQPVVWINAKRSGGSITVGKLQNCTPYLQRLASQPKTATVECACTPQPIIFFLQST